MFIFVLTVCFIQIFNKIINDLNEKIISFISCIKNVYLRVNALKYWNNY